MCLRDHLLRSRRIISPVGRMVLPMHPQFLFFFSRSALLSDSQIRSCYGLIDSRVCWRVWWSEEVCNELLLCPDFELPYAAQVDTCTSCGGSEGALLSRRTPWQWASETLSCCLLWRAGQSLSMGFVHGFHGIKGTVMCILLDCDYCSICAHLLLVVIFYQ